MKRRLLNLLTALSLLLCVAVVVLWVRSHWRWEQWVVETPHRSHLIALLTGGVKINFFWSKGRVRENWDVHREGPFPAPQPLVSQPKTALNRLGFLYARKDRSNGGMGALVFPYWCVLFACGVPPALRLLGAIRRSRRTRLNLCPSCGYDLRATPGRCPECGTPEKAPHETRLLNL